MILTGLVTRPLVPGGPLADLALENPGVVRIVSCHPGGVVRQRGLVEGRFVHGRFLTSVKDDATSVGLVLRVYGSTASQLDSNTATVFAAFDQWSYELAVTIDGVAHRWVCEPADYQPTSDAGFDKFELAMLQQAYSLSIPRSPVQLAGAL